MSELRAFGPGANEPPWAARCGHSCAKRIAAGAPRSHTAGDGGVSFSLASNVQHFSMSLTIEFARSKTYSADIDKELRPLPTRHSASRYSRNRETVIGD